MTLTFSKKSYRQVIGFFLSMYICLTPLTVYASSSLNSLAGSNSWMLKELGMKSVSAAATADAAMVVNITGVV